MVFIIIGTIILILLFILVPILVTYYSQKKVKRKTELINLFGKFHGTKKEVIGSLALFSALLIGFVFLSTGLTIIELNDLEHVDETLEETFKETEEVFWIFLIVGVFAEELFFRAFLIKGLKTIFNKYNPKKELNNVLAIVISTFLFAIMHFGYGSIAEILGAFFLGLILATWYSRRESLIQNYFGHLLYNLVAISMYFLQ